MTTTGLEVVDWHGELALRAVSDDLVAVVLPARGGRIASLLDRDGREWLEVPVLPLTPVADLPGDFVAGDMFGWDECAPDDRRLPPRDVGDA